MTELDTLPQATMSPSLDPDASIDLVPTNPPAETAPETALTTTTATEKKKTVKRIVKKRRPARPQVDPSTFKTEPPPQTGTIFNIWYNKWSGGDRDDALYNKRAAAGRCNVARDSGFTRADRQPGSYFCLFFARGLCPKGQECEYLHRLPGLHDIFNPNIDCFGREKHSDYRDDMGGVGSFLRQNRTLYVGKIHVTDDIEEVVSRHFQEWGQIDRIRVLPARGVGFVTYTNEANAQFGKEAMAHQSLDHNEVLNVRWATVDPNPQAQKREARLIEEQAAEAVRRALPAEYVAEIEGRNPEATKRRKLEGTFGLQGYEAPDDVWYASEKAALEARKNGGLLEAPEEQLSIEPAPVVEQQDGGIFSGSTLAALKGYSAGLGVSFKAANGDGSKPSAGPLVGYGSDDEDD
ncbi:Pre-mRNA-splicing factor [Coniosporium uncinatum]|uniref:Pre-mRNA-splicing factor n=1 Tax=Coniosporium uncinatum TaxID=93489 RepID=A0ACC3D5J7_9PEZI|nr:Pre-mRNA-splicing factor [Coniosporium uncinatum]